MGFDNIEDLRWIFSEVDLCGWFIFVFVKVLAIGHRNHVIKK